MADVISIQGEEIRRIKTGDMVQNMHTGRVIIIDKISRDYFTGTYYWDKTQRETYSYDQFDTDVELYDRTRSDTESIPRETQEPRRISQDDLDRAVTRGDQRHQAALSYAAKAGQLRGDLSGIRSRLAGLLNGAIPAMLADRYGIYNGPGGLEFALNMITEYLEEARQAIDTALNRD